MHSLTLRQEFKFGIRVERRKRKLTRRLVCALRYLSGKQGRKLVQYGLTMALIVLVVAAFGNSVAERINQTYANVAYTLRSQIR